MYQKKKSANISDFLTHQISVSLLEFLYRSGSSPRVDSTSPLGPSCVELDLCLESKGHAC